MRGETGILPVMEVGNNNGFNGFGGDGAWWIIILLLFKNPGVTNEKKYDY